VPRTSAVRLRLWQSERDAGYRGSLHIQLGMRSQRHGAGWAGHVVPACVAEHGTSKSLPGLRMAVTCCPRWMAEICRAGFQLALFANRLDIMFFEWLDSLAYFATTFPIPLTATTYTGVDLCTSVADLICM
jgi:hypothetical protein